MTDLVNTTKAARALGVTVKTITRWVASGAPHKKRGRAFKINVQAIAEWARQHGKTGAMGGPTIVGAACAPVMCAPSTDEVDVDLLAQTMGGAGDNGDTEPLNLAQLRRDLSSRQLTEAEGARLKQLYAVIMAEWKQEQIEKSRIANARLRGELLVTNHLRAGFTQYADALRRTFERLFEMVAEGRRRDARDVIDAGLAEAISSAERAVNEAAERGKG